MHPRLGPLAALLSLPFVAHAQPNPDLEQIVVTATRQESRISEVLADMTVIGRAEIERFAGGTMMELLARQPGIQISTSGGPGTSASLYVRGTRPDQTKILVDGMPINSLDLSGSPLRYLPLANVERIEILRGLGATMYGADAVGGVIQIFTRRGSPGFKADTFVGAGNHGSYQAGAGLAGGDAHWRFRIDGSHDYSDSVSAQKNARNRDADRDSYRNSAGSVSLSFLPAAGQELGVLYRRNEGRAHYDSGMTPADGNFDAYVDFETEQWQLFSNNRMNDVWTSRLQYARAMDRQDDYASWAPQGSYLQTHGKQLSWQNDVSLPLGTAVLGIERLQQEASPAASFTGDRRISLNGVFAGWNADLGPHRWQLSARNDDHSRFGNESTHALGYGYQLSPQWRLQGSYATSFKAPSLYQLYDQYSGNAGLEAEKGKNREVALVWERGMQSASATWYLNRIDDMIDWSFATWRYLNVSKARLEGVTLAWSGRVGDWALHASYDWLDATNEDTGLRLGRRARNTLVLGADRSRGALTGGIELAAASARHDSNSETGSLGGYGLLNLNARYALSRSLSIEGRIDNLFDRDYELSRGYNTLGRSAFIGIRYAQ